MHQAGWEDLYYMAYAYPVVGDHLEDEHDAVGGILEEISFAIEDGRQTTIPFEDVEALSAWFDREFLSPNDGRMSTAGYLDYWLSIKTKHPLVVKRGHPLDGERDLSVDYAEGLTFPCADSQCMQEAVHSPAIKNVAKACFFHILSTIEKLEDHKAQHKDVYLRPADICAIHEVLKSHHTANSKEWANTVGQKDFPQSVFSAKVETAAMGGKGLKFGRRDILQVLLKVEKMARPKPKKGSVKPTASSAAGSSANKPQTSATGATKAAAGSRKCESQ